MMDNPSTAGVGSASFETTNKFKLLTAVRILWLKLNNEKLKLLNMSNCVTILGCLIHSSDTRWYQEGNLRQCLDFMC